ncbi:MAG: protein kinase [Peptoclostridium sp.]|uniref:serine/threonine protein kinase n=1 Tax=Peptoclostridium sp. TaxID=1904860 RepID=UPI00139B7E9C|nr:protein kinase family protein [Peptoclostridium sp.]MZQ74708.1 protein kinase [Peptoclostridium sp.]
MVLDIFRKDKLYPVHHKLFGYEILSILGEGRYGICYIAEKDGKKYVLKQLKLKMFKKIGHKAEFEEKILSCVSHERIPRFIQNIKTCDSSIYIMDFIDGKTFEEIIFADGRVFSVGEIHDIALQLIDILKHLHGLGIVHRDIRVPNVVYSAGRVYLVDFGLARHIDGRKYTADVDFSYLGDFLIHLHYTSFKPSGKKSRPWYDELELPDREMLILKKLMGIDGKYESICEVENDFIDLKTI